MAGNNLSREELVANAREMAGGDQELFGQIMEQVNLLLQHRAQAQLERMQRAFESNGSDTEFAPSSGFDRHSSSAQMTGPAEAVCARLPKESRASNVKSVYQRDPGITLLHQHRVDPQRHCCLGRFVNAYFGRILTTLRSYLRALDPQRPAEPST